MKLEPIHMPDLDFKYVSPFLKRTLKKHFNKKGHQALDVPCGTGRNLFLLAQYFEEVKGVDLEEQYLSAIYKIKEIYKCDLVKLEHKDVLKNAMSDIAQYDFVCNIHFYSTYLTAQIMPRLKTGALFLLETPSCHGGNYRELPTEDELNAIFRNDDILQYSFTPCNHKENINKTGAAQVLIRKK